MHDPVRLLDARDALPVEYEADARTSVGVGVGFVHNASRFRRRYGVPCSTRRARCSRSWSKLDAPRQSRRIQASD